MERNPQPDDTLLAAPLAALTKVVTRWPQVTLGVAIFLAATAATLAVAQMGFRTSRLDLLNPTSDFNKLWLNYLEEFRHEDDAVIVVEGGRSDDVLPVIAEIAEQLEHQPELFRSVLHRVDLSAMRSKGLHYLAPGELAEIESDLQRVSPVLDGDWSQMSLAKLLAPRSQHGAGQGTLGQSSDTGDAVLSPTNDIQVENDHAHAARLAYTLSAAFDGRGQYVSPWARDDERLAQLEELKPQYMLADKGRLGFVLLRLGGDESGFDQGTEAIDRLRQVIKQISAKHDHVNIGLTGLPVIENDEMRSSQRDMLTATTASLIGVASLFIACFGGIRHPIMTVAALLLALAWSFGYITLSVGHLNILSVSFAVILIGLGIDFGIHYVAAYLHLREQGDDVNHALISASRNVGPGIFTGGLTTALAFFTATLTQFTGVAELGVIAGGGILLCIVAALLVLPSMIAISDRSANATLPKPLPVERWLSPLSAAPGLTLVFMLLATVTLAWALPRLRYDHNLLNLLPEGSESVTLERKLLERSDHSVWYALSIAESREELFTLQAKFEDLPTVQRTEEIASLMPDEVDVKQPTIGRIATKLETLPETAPLIPVTNLDEFAARLAFTAQGMSDGPPRLRAASAHLQTARAAIVNLPPEEAYRRLSELQQRIATDLLVRLKTLQSLANPSPPTFDDLPPSLVDRFIGNDGQYLLKIYGNGDIWDQDALSAFVADVKSVDPNATGQPLQTFYASNQMQSSYLRAALYSLFAVAIVLLVDFHSFRLTLLAMLPLAVGLVQLFGLMSWLDLSLNPANLIVLPLILGIGIDDGVHVVHDFRRRTGRYTLGRSTATGILLTSLTTMVGFGSLMLAQHQGLQSLGRVLVLGVMCCLFTSLVLLPALLRLISRNEPAEINSETISTVISLPLEEDSSGELPEATPIRRRNATPGEPSPEVA